MISAIFNRGWLLTGYRDYVYFQKNIHHVAAVQSKKLLELLKMNQDTAFGTQYRFSQINNYRQFADTIPLLEDYDVMQPYICRISDGESDVLFPGKPAFFESTSGSTSMSKLIPYNAQLKREFQTGVNVWMNDLYRQHEGLFDGPAYWSVSPQMKENYHTKGGIPVGISADTAYFNPLTTWFMKFMLVPPPVAEKERTAHEFYVATWRNLIIRKDLRFISVWSPNFLLRLYAFLQEHFREILKYASIPKKRKSELEAICSQPFTFHDLFPELKLLSCWTQAQAKLWIEEVREVLGDVAIQGKGLLSTEGMVSIPMQFDRQALTYTSHFYEFRCRKSGWIFLAEDLDVGEVYEVIITTGGGLYRYCTGDKIRCVGFLERLPCLEFIGRGNAVSDMVGEKLNANLLPDLFLAAKHQNEGEIKTMYLYASKDNKQAGYLLLIEGKVDEIQAASLAHNLHCSLMENPYYGQAIANGQLNPLKPMVMSLGFSDHLFEFYCREHKIKDGDAKIPLLFKPGALKDLLDY